jgi:Domain of unknown function (DUF4365)
MRASQSGLTGAEGQAAVEQQFVRLRWGVARNPVEHDLGTDLWLMARDPRRFDLGALVGAQVKSGGSWFNSPERDGSGEVVGWWFSDTDGKHFRYWKDHNVPHILVLHNLNSGTSYWVRLAADRFVSTGKGSKILVPADQTIDEEHLPALLVVATGQRRPAQWEGSAFLGNEPILRPDRLRHALLTPRLIAPHPNLAVDGYQPDEAIAVLVKMRLRELRPSKPPYWTTKAPDLETCRASKDWEWRFYAALYASLVGGGGLDAVRELIDADEAAPHQRAAAAAVCGALLLETNQPNDALAVIDRLIAADECEPIDHSWLTLHRSRCLAELGLLEHALEGAVEVQGLRATAPYDPTATAIVGAAADLIFGISAWSSRNVADAVTGRDTLAAWWRTQEVAWALQEKASEDFKKWAEDRTVSWGKSDQTWLHLRAATLISGFTADHTAWRATASMLAQRVVTTSDGNVDALVSALTLMRHAGDREAFELSIRRLLRGGPVQAAREAVSALDLEGATRTTLRANIAAITEAADILSVEDAGRHMRWAVEVLNDPSVLATQLAPSFAIPDAVLDMLEALAPGLSTSDLRIVQDHVIALPPQEDQAIAHGYAAVVREMPTASWSDDDRVALALRNSDNFELVEAFQIVLAAADEKLRYGLLAQIAGGDLAALEAFGDVRDLDGETVIGLVAQLSKDIRQEVAELKSGQSSVRTVSFGGTLVLVNHWHPDQADWEPLLESLDATRTFSRHLRKPLEHIHRLRPAIPETVLDRLEPILRSIVITAPGPGAKLFGSPDVRGDAAAALESVRPSAVSDAELWDLMSGSENQRAGAAMVVAMRKQLGDINLLAALAHDPSQWVRAVVANQLTEWIGDGIAAESASALVCRLLDSGGTLVARMVAVRLDGLPATAAADRVAEELDGSPSVFTRQQIQAYRSASGSGRG